MLIYTFSTAPSKQRDLVQNLLERAEPPVDQTQRRHTQGWPVTNVKASSEREFWHYGSIYTFDADVYAGHVEIRPGVYASVRLYVCLNGHYGQGGFAVAKVFSCSNEEENAAHRALGHRYPYEWPIEYFTWSACDHEYESKSGGNCYHIYTCKRCGHRYDVDSSD